MKVLPVPPHETLKQEGETGPRRVKLPSLGKQWISGCEGLQTSLMYGAWGFVKTLGTICVYFFPTQSEKDLSTELKCKHELLFPLTSNDDKGDRNKS